MKKTEPEEQPELTLTPKLPRHTSIAKRHLEEQRAKAIAVRDRAAKEVEQLDAALLPLM